MSLADKGKAMQKNNTQNNNFTMSPFIMPINYTEINIKETSFM